MDIYNIYCDESCYMQNDKHGIMAFGALWCKNSEVKRISSHIESLKEKHNARGELKWTKVSKSREGFYKELLAYFIEEQDLHFRCLVVPDKGKLQHDRYNNNSHDDFYYKMYFSLLSKILSPDSQYNIYLDIKDTRSREKIRKLEEVLCNDKYDFTQSLIGKMQNIRSEESHLLQVCDFLLGAVSYKIRNLTGNKTKESIVNAIAQELQIDFNKSTPLWEQKFNLFLLQLR